MLCGSRSSRLDVLRRTSVLPWEKNPHQPCSAQVDRSKGRTPQLEVSETVDPLGGLDLVNSPTGGAHSGVTDFPSTRKRGGQDTSIDRAQQIAVRSLSSLAPLASMLQCVLVQPELRCDALSNIGFQVVQTPEDVRTNKAASPLDSSAILVVTATTDVGACESLVSALSCNPDTQPIIAVMLVPFEEGPEGNTCTESQWDDVLLATQFEVGTELEGARAALYDAGVDDVMCLINGEELTCHRILESLHKTELMAARMAGIIAHEVGFAEKKAHATFKKFVMLLPGTVLETIPYEDAMVPEERDKDNNLISVDGHVFQDKLGTGSFGYVCKTHHQGQGQCAVKVISKSSVVKSPANLFNLEREMSILMHLEGHPNIIKAHKALHTQHNFLLVMEYAGQVNLQAFVKDYLGKSKEETLPLPLIKSLLQQEAGALAHLHSSMVCHRDLKPANWIISDAGDTVRLGDFGLATQVIGPGQMLRQSCGSLPFCPPEVLTAGQGGEGYNGFSADMWSLGVNFLELLCGPYSVEQLLGWFPKLPLHRREILSNLSALPRLWGEARLASSDHTGCGHMVTNMIVLCPKQRWRIRDVLEGLPSKKQHARAPRLWSRRFHSNSGTAPGSCS